jgi:hypothetical protein
MQVDVRLPAGISANTAADVIRTVGEARSQASVTVAVQ